MKKSEYLNSPEHMLPPLMFPLSDRTDYAQGKEWTHVSGARNSGTFKGTASKFICAIRFFNLQTDDLESHSGDSVWSANKLFWPVLGKEPTH